MTRRYISVALAACCVAGGFLCYFLFSGDRPAPQPLQPAASITPPPPPEPAPALDAKSTTILELFNPSDAVLTHQLNESEISQRMEQIFVTSFVLSNCHLLSTDEYRDTFRALILYAMQTGLAVDVTSAEARARAIAESASTSYRLVYRATQCDEPKLPQIAHELQDWRAAYLR